MLNEITGDPGSHESGSPLRFPATGPCVGQLLANSTIIRHVVLFQVREIVVTAPSERQAHSRVESP
jgi:hypothetical protein